MRIEDLGTIYERSLAMEKRKADGIFYTPPCIVDYIVNNTIGVLLKDKASAEAAKIKIIDPACGAGCFLLGAYQFLLDWHEKQIGKLSLQKRKRILMNNIFGVDIDVNAVEVTKLSLLLKCMDGETTASIESTQKLFHEKVLPDIDSNILCGNSLIDTNFYDNNSDAETERQIRPFHWQNAFPAIFKQGGFDAVIGNPPYVNLVAIPKIQRQYFQQFYETCKNKSDLYSFFLEKACAIVKPETGYFGFIVPHTWQATESFELLRKKLLDEKRIQKIVDLGANVFKEVTVSTVILICTHGSDKIAVKNKDFSERLSVSANDWIQNNYQIDLEWNAAKAKLYKKLQRKTVTCDLHFGQS